MNYVTIRELRNHGGEVVDRAAAGELITITRNGTPVAELRLVRRHPALDGRLDPTVQVGPRVGGDVGDTQHPLPRRRPGPD